MYPRKNAMVQVGQFVLTPCPGHVTIRNSTVLRTIVNAWDSCIHRKHTFSMPMVSLQPTQSQAIQRWLERCIDVALCIFVGSTVVSVSIMQIFSGLALLAWLGRWYLGGSPIRSRPPLLWPFLSFLLAALLSTVLAIDPSRSLWEMRDLFAATVFFLVALQVTLQRAIRLTHVLIAVGTLMAVYGLLQSVMYGVEFRIHGTMSIYMTFAGLLMLVATLALARVLFCTRNSQTLWVVAALPVLLAALLLTHTRNAWLGLAIGFAVVLGLRQKRLLLLLPCLALGAFLLAPGTVQERLRSVVDPQTLTAQQRFYIWERGVQIIQDYPWTGVGLGGLPRLYSRYRVPHDPRDSGRRHHLHNNVLQVTAEGGLIGLACWLTVWTAFYRYSMALYRRLPPEAQDARAFVVGSLACVTGFHIAGLFEYNFGDVEVITLLYFIMALPVVVAYAQENHAGRCPTTA
jgi:O-antigen ligase